MNGFSAAAQTRFTSAGDPPWAAAAEGSTSLCGIEDWVVEVEFVLGKPPQRSRALGRLITVGGQQHPLDRGRCWRWV
jgi:hypothetical protein